ncbi:hypothetical protein ACIPY0_12200 [Paenarthrobacter nicotinovorans]|uniref:hypothetical protein n=1 Tax=Paenarthrobacter nicotinovorans TaxID=29320 RepID=UPI00381D74F4
MRLIDAESLTALTGSRPADEIVVWAWRGNELILPDPLEVIDWSFEDTADDSWKVNQRIKLTVADPAGALGAWRLDDPLSVTGTELVIRYKIGGAATVNYGRFRVTANEPDEVTDWRTIDEYGYVEMDGELAPHKRDKPSTRAVVKLDAVDLTEDVDRDRLEAPESPALGSTAISEATRLMGGRFPVVVDPGITDVPVSSKLIFERERLEAVQDLLSRVSAKYRMGGDGECHFYPKSSHSVLRIGPREGLVKVSRKQSLVGLYNRWVVEGKQAGSGAVVRAAVNVDTGPLRYGGPHGKYPAFYSSEMVTTTAHALLYATDLREKFLNSLALELVVQIVPHPELQAGDRVEVGCPVAAGHVSYIPGDITDIKRSGKKTPGPTTLTVVCSYADVNAALQRTEWAQWLTPELPELTWDRIPGTWGTLPSITWNKLP